MSELGKDFRSFLGSFWFNDPYQQMLHKWLLVCDKGVIEDAPTRISRFNLLCDIVEIDRPDCFDGFETSREFSYELLRYWIRHPKYRQKIQLLVEMDML